MAGTSPAMTIVNLSSVLRPDNHRARLTSEDVPHRGADRGRRFGDNRPGAAQRLHLVARAALAAGDNGAGMAHPSSGRRGAPGDKPNERLLPPRRLQEIGAILFRRPAHLTDPDARL